MPPNIKNPETVALAHEVAPLSGQERLKRIAVRDDREPRLAEMRAISQRVAALPDLDTRSADEIIGYDENGLPS
jgi:antitoxin VapB